MFNNTKEIGESNESQAKYQVQKIDGNSEHNASESSCPCLRGLPVHGSHLVLDHSNPTVIPTLRNEVNPMNDLLSVFETKKTGTKLSKIIVIILFPRRRVNSTIK